MGGGDGFEPWTPGSIRRSVENSPVLEFRSALVRWRPRNGLSSAGKAHWDARSRRACRPAALATAALTEDGKLRNMLMGTRILFDDAPAALIYVSAGQSSAIVPYGVAGRASTRVVVEYQGNMSVAVTMPVMAAKPALFSANSTGRGQGAILNQDGSPNTVTNRAAKGSVIVLFGTGEGATTPAGVRTEIVG